MTAEPTKDDVEWQDMLAAIGLVAHTSAYHESLLGSLYTNLLGSPLGSAVTQGLGVESTLQALGSLVKRLRQDLGNEHEKLNRLADALQRSRELNQRRNLVIHGVWQGIPSLMKPATVQLLKRWGTEIHEPWSLQELDDLCDEIVNHQDELIVLTLMASLDAFRLPGSGGVTTVRPAQARPRTRWRVASD